MRGISGPVPPVLVVHQEGVVGLLALAGLALGRGDLLAPLAAVQPLPVSVGVGVAVGLVSAGLLWLLRRLPSMAALEGWQRQLVGSWSVSEAVAVALISGVAEEALIRAVLQPLIGLWLAALVFALLHVAPDRRLWMWPLVAVTIGLVFGVLYELSGYPACAAGHVTVNLVALLRLRRRGAPEGAQEDREETADNS